MKTQRGRVELAWHLANHDFVRYFELMQVLEKSFTDFSDCRHWECVLIQC